MRVVETFFGEFMVRFVRQKSVQGRDCIYVVRDDFIKAASDCMTGIHDEIKSSVFSAIINFGNVAGDKNRALVSKGSVEALISVPLIMKSVSLIAGLVNHENEALSESARRLHAFEIWFIHKCCEIDKKLGFEDWDLLQMMKERLDIKSPPIIVTVEHEADTGGWIAYNDEIPFAVEADSYEDLVEEAWKLAPEAMAENNISITHPLRLSFVMDTCEPVAMAM